MSPPTEKVCRNVRRLWCFLELSYDSPIAGEKDIRSEVLGSSQVPDTNTIQNTEVEFLDSRFEKKSGALDSISSQQMSMMGSRFNEFDSTLQSPPTSQFLNLSAEPLRQQTEHIRRLSMEERDSHQRGKSKSTQFREGTGKHRYARSALETVG